MPTLRDFQASFGASVRGASATGLGLIRENGIPLERRMDVYRNNVHASLIDALASAYPVVERLVGRDFFRAMALEFLRAHMPQNRTLTGFGGTGFGGELPEFLEDFGPASSLPYLGDVARVDRAWLTAYHGADYPAIDADALAQVAPEDLGELRFHLHPTVQFVTSRYPIWSIWRTNKEDEIPSGVDLTSGGETVCLLRPDAGVEVHLVNRGTAKLGEGLSRGLSLGAAFDAARLDDETFDLGNALHLFLSGGAFVRVVHEPFLGAT